MVRVAAAICVAWLGLAFLAPGCAALAAEPGQAEFFEKRIRPVLIKHCYECHSAEAESPKGGLLLDHRQGLLDGGDSGPALVPGSPDESLLLDALRYDGLEMPPAARLPEAVLRDFEQWVKMGAPDPRDEPPAGHAPRGVDIEQGRRFWAFQPVVAHAAPPVGDAAWPANWIDHFILARLESAGLKPAPQADRERLLRRVTYDLTGLPPTVEEMEAFASDGSDEAWERVVDRLLGSPQFGEHWGRRWLDVARYADSNGSDFNATFHEAWRYRNYVVEALNHDKPLDQFIREQIAGDLLPYHSDAQRTEQVVATGFLMLSAKMLSERDKEKLRMDVVDEQIDTVGRAFLGLTLGCARCHDHKFDPVPTEDYYALAGIFRNTVVLEGEIQRYVSNWVRQPLPVDPEQAQARARWEKEKKGLAARIAEAKEAMKEAETLAVAQAPAKVLGVVVDDGQAKLVGNWKPSTFSPHYFGRGYVHDDDSAKGQKSASFVPDLPAAGEYEVRLAYNHGPSRAADVPIRIVHAEGETEVKFSQQSPPAFDNLFSTIGRFRFQAGQAGSVTLSTEGTKGYVIVDAVQFIPVAELAAQAVAVATGSPEEEKENPADDPAEAVQAELKTLEEEMKRLEKAAPAPPPRALAVREVDRKQIGDCHLCIRGEHNNRGKVVPRGVLQVALYGEPPKFPADQSGRRELADWIAHPQNPLTARVAVNRVWCHLLGEGLVRSVDNFGTLGDRPSHPELLDQLALELVNEGWSLKAIIRQVALSRTYRQDTRHDEASYEIDPENRLLWRAHRRRLPAEAMRDTMLAVSGRLELATPGSPVAGLGTLVTQNRPGDDSFSVGEMNFRTLYLPIVRNELPAMLTAFDFADPEFVVGQRSATTVPSQALFLLNSPEVIRTARQTAERLLAEASQSDPGRADWAYRTLLGRTPSEAERARAVEFVRAVIGEAPGDEKQRAAREQAAWSRLLHALLASTEFRMLD